MREEEITRGSRAWTSAGRIQVMSGIDGVGGKNHMDGEKAGPAEADAVAEVEEGHGKAYAACRSILEPTAHCLVSGNARQTVRYVCIDGTHTNE